MRNLAVRSPGILRRGAALGCFIGVAALTHATLLSGRAPAPPTAIVVIIVDTLRADRLAAWGQQRAVMPRLDRWLQRSVLFEQARAPSPWTFPSFASMYTGYYPARHGARVVDPLGVPRSFVSPDEELPRIAEILRDGGWDTAGFTTNHFLDRDFGLARGFSTYEQNWKSAVSPPRANVAVDAALTWLDDTAGAPFFLALHVFDPHLPYDPPPATAGRFSADYQGEVELPIRQPRKVRSRQETLGDADREFIENVYDEDVAFADEHLGRFLDELESRGILDHALVVLTSDHGEEFWDHGSFEHGHTLFDELLLVPLAVWAPGLEPRRIPEAVSLVDLMPTLLDAADFTVPEGLDGVSLWPSITLQRPLPTRPILAGWPLYVKPQRAIIEWPWKLIEIVDQSRRELYNLETDPTEERNVAGEHADVVARLTAIGEQRFAAPPDSGRADVEVEVDDEALEALRSLGYVD